MLRVSFHFVGDLDIVETWPDDTSRTELQRRAVALGCLMFTPEVCDGDGPDGDDVVGGSLSGLRGGLLLGGYRGERS